MLWFSVNSLHFLRKRFFYIHCLLQNKSDLFLKSNLKSIWQSLLSRMAVLFLKNIVKSTVKISVLRVPIAILSVLAGDLILPAWANNRMLSDGLLSG